MLGNQMAAACAVRPAQKAGRENQSYGLASLHVSFKPYVIRDAYNV